MRKILSQLGGGYHRFSARIDGGNKKFLCLHHIHLIQKKRIYICDHLYVYRPKHLRKLKLHKGDIIYFDAKTRIYKKSNKEYDYGLTTPKRISKKGIS